MNKQPQPNYDFLDNSISQPQNSKQPKSKSKSKPKNKSPKNNVVSPPNMKQAKPKPPVKSKPKVIAVVKKTKPTPQQKPNNPNVMTPTNMDKLKQSNNQAEYLKNLKKSNSQNIDNSNTTLFNDIISNQEELNIPALTIKKYSTIINQMKKLFFQSNILLTNGDLIESILKYMKPLMDTISKNYKVNTQRSILSNIIMLLTYTNENVSPVKIKAVELQRKKSQLKAPVKENV